MARRYVPKTYNNRRLLRVVFGTVILVVVAFIVLFVLLFFALDPYFIDGSLQIPWLNN